MGKINFNVDAINMEDVLRYVDRVDLLPGKSLGALEKGARILLQEAKKTVPDVSGDLKKSLKIGHRKKSSRYSVEVGTFYPDAPYAHLVEHGHGGQKAAKANPYLQTAVDNVGDIVTGVITKELLDEFGKL